MWVVKNRLRATLKIEGTSIEIGPGEEVDLDRHGRGYCDELLPLAVALEEGYLENVFKSAEEAEAAPQPESSPAHPAVPGASKEDLEAFKQSILEEIRRAVPDEVKPRVETPSDLSKQFDSFRDELREGVKGMMASLGEVHERLVREKERIKREGNLSDVEIRARLAFIEETERKLSTNFERLGHEVEHDDDGESDVAGYADLLAGID